MTVIIETPQGSHYKYKYEPKEKKFVVNKTLPDDMVFPFDFGFVPDTRGEDGDPLDVLILSKAPHFTATSLHVRIIGCLPAKQTNEEGTLRNDRYVGVEEEDENYSDIQSIEQLPEEMINDIQTFFINYLSVEGKKVVFLPMLDAKQAQGILQIAKS